MSSSLEPSFHNQGMYSDKFFHKKVQTEAGRYVTIGDPYRDQAMTLPGRWQKKQFTIDKLPKNSGNGYFGLMGRPFTYVPDRYVAQVPYAKSQPFSERKLGFGTHDAHKRDEFTHRIRTEQYRDLLKREKRLIASFSEADLQKVKSRLELQKETDQKLRAAVNLEPPLHLYDIGKTRETPFDPALPRDRFYNTSIARRRPMRRGPYRTMSQEIGDQVTNHSFADAIRTKCHATRNFYSRGHIEIGDL